MKDHTKNQSTSKGFFSFEQLDVWSKAHQLTLEVYKATDTFPHQEKFGLTSQFRRAAGSVAANLAEGNERKSAKEYLQYCYQAKGSLIETANHLLLAKDLHYLQDETYFELREQIIAVKKMLSGLITYLKKKV